MDKFIKRSVLALLFIVAPITPFYSPDFPLYVLGELREGSINTWLALNFWLTVGLATIYLLLRALSKPKWPITLVLFVILVLLIVNHGVPSLLYWDTLVKDGIIHDDIGTPGPQASVLMFLWHLSIVIYSLILGLVLVFKPIRNRWINTR